MTHGHHPDPHKKHEPKERHPYHPPEPHKDPDYLPRPEPAPEPKPAEVEEANIDWVYWTLGILIAAGIAAYFIFH